MSRLVWQKSSFSGSDAGQECLELATAPDGTIRLRESDDPAVVIRTTPARLRAFIHAVKTGVDGIAR